MYKFVTSVFLLAVTVSVGDAQLINIAGSTSVTMIPHNATCGLTSASSFCRVKPEKHYTCDIESCGKHCEVRHAQYTDLLHVANGSVIMTTDSFIGDSVAVAKFSKQRFYVLRGTIRINPSVFTLAFWIRPDDMEKESSVIDFHGSANTERRLFNVTIGSDLKIKFVSRFHGVTDTKWVIPRHAWTHIAVKVHYSESTYIEVFLNGSHTKTIGLYLDTTIEMSNLVMVIGQPFEGTLEKQFYGQLADMRLYDYSLSSSNILHLSCEQFKRNTHYIEKATDSDPKTFWMSRPLDSVDLAFDLNGTYQLEDISLTFCGRIPNEVKILKTMPADNSWKMLHVFRYSCNTTENECTSTGGGRYDGYNMRHSLSTAKVTRWASSLRIYMSGHRTLGPIRTDYFSLYDLAIRVTRLCEQLHYREHASMTSCLPCNCDIRGVIDRLDECAEIGGQCTCKRYVTGRRCDQCLSGHDNLQQKDTDGCSRRLDTTEPFHHSTSPKSDMTTSFDQDTSPMTDNLVETTTLFNLVASSRKSSVTSERPTKSNSATDRSSTPSLQYTNSPTETPTTSSSTTDSSLTSWLLYKISIYIVVIVVIVTIIIVVSIAVMCVRSRRRR